MTDYDRVARLITFLDEHHTEQPDLARLADTAGLSPSQLHRLFSRWAAITPKHFLACVTFEHARRLLREGRSVLDTALSAGLSGPGRLHDLCLSLESASPGEIKGGSEPLKVVAGFAPTVFGTCLIGESRRGVCHLSFLDEGGETAAWADLQQRWPEASLQRNDAAALRLAVRVFRQSLDPSSRPALRAFVRGTPFQVQVWRALMRVRLGHLTTYGRLAEAVGHPTAARAVGAAVGRNPLAYLIPCHRVIRETGAIGEYHWGSTRKQIMVAYESARAAADDQAGKKAAYF
jgi:AraC family transcriptional regulator, regulatory protein of adaptative response / methylated-DNA-[protein]-cysteine methyltransferase